MTVYGDSEITDMTMGAMPMPFWVPSLGSTPGEREKPGQRPAKLQQQLAGKGVRKRTEVAQREEEGKGAKKSCYDPTQMPNSKVLLSCLDVRVLPMLLV